VINGGHVHSTQKHVQQLLMSSW